MISLGVDPLLVESTDGFRAGALGYTHDSRIFVYCRAALHGQPSGTDPKPIEPSDGCIIMQGWFAMTLVESLATGVSGQLVGIATSKLAQGEYGWFQLWGETKVKLVQSGTQPRGEVLYPADADDEGKFTTSSFASGLRNIYLHGGAPDADGLYGATIHNPTLREAHSFGTGRSNVPDAPARTTRDQRYELLVSASGIRSWALASSVMNLPAAPARGAESKDYQLRVPPTGTALSWTEAPAPGDSLPTGFPSSLPAPTDGATVKYAMQGANPSGGGNDTTYSWESIREGPANIPAAPARGVADVNYALKVPSDTSEAVGWVAGGGGLSASGARATVQAMLESGNGIKIQKYTASSNYRTIIESDTVKTFNSDGSGTTTETITRTLAYDYDKVLLRFEGSRVHTITLDPLNNNDRVVMEIENAKDNDQNVTVTGRRRGSTTIDTATLPNSGNRILAVWTDSDASNGKWQFHSIRSGGITGAGTTPDGGATEFKHLTDAFTSFEDRGGQLIRIAENENVLEPVQRIAVGNLPTQIPASLITGLPEASAVVSESATYSDAQAKALNGKNLIFAGTADIVIGLPALAAADRVAFLAYNLSANDSDLTIRPAGRSDILIADRTRAESVIWNGSNWSATTIISPHVQYLTDLLDAPAALEEDAFLAVEFGQVGQRLPGTASNLENSEATARAWAGSTLASYIGQRAVNVTHPETIFFRYPSAMLPAAFNPDNEWGFRDAENLGYAAVETFTYNLARRSAWKLTEGDLIIAQQTSGADHLDISDPRLLPASGNRYIHSVRVHGYGANKGITTLTLSANATGAATAGADLSEAFEQRGIIEIQASWSSTGGAIIRVPLAGHDRDEPYLVVPADSDARNAIHASLDDIDDVPAAAQVHMIVRLLLPYPDARRWYLENPGGTHEAPYVFSSKRDVHGAPAVRATVADEWSAPVVVGGLPERFTDTTEEVSPAQADNVFVSAPGREAATAEIELHLATRTYWFAANDALHAQDSDVPGATGRLRIGSRDAGPETGIFAVAIALTEARTYIITDRQTPLGSIRWGEGDDDTAVLTALAGTGSWDGIDAERWRVWWADATMGIEQDSTLATASFTAFSIFDADRNPLFTNRGGARIARLSERKLKEFVGEPALRQERDALQRAVDEIADHSPNVDVLPLWDRGFATTPPIVLTSPLASTTAMQFTAGAFDIRHTVAGADRSMVADLLDDLPNAWPKDGLIEATFQYAEDGATWLTLWKGLVDSYRREMVSPISTTFAVGDPDAHASQAFRIQLAWADEDSLASTALAPIFKAVPSRSIRGAAVTAGGEIYGMSEARADRLVARFKQHLAEGAARPLHISYRNADGQFAEADVLPGSNAVERIDVGNGWHDNARYGLRFWVRNRSGEAEPAPRSQAVLAWGDRPVDYASTAGEFTVSGSGVGSVNIPAGNNNWIEWPADDLWIVLTARRIGGTRKRVKMQYALNGAGADPDTWHDLHDGVVGPTPKTFNLGHGFRHPDNDGRLKLRLVSINTNNDNESTSNHADGSVELLVDRSKRDYIVRKVISDDSVYSVLAQSMDIVRAYMVSTAWQDFDFDTPVEIDAIEEAVIEINPDDRTVANSLPGNYSVHFTADALNDLGFNAAAPTSGSGIQSPIKARMIWHRQMANDPSIEVRDSLTPFWLSVMNTAFVMLAFRREGAYCTGIRTAGFGNPVEIRKTSFRTRQPI